MKTVLKENQLMVSCLAQYRYLFHIQWPCLFITWLSLTQSPLLLFELKPNILPVLVFVHCLWNIYVCVVWFIFILCNCEKNGMSMYIYRRNFAISYWCQTRWVWIFPTATKFQIFIASCQSYVMPLIQPIMNCYIFIIQGNKISFVILKVLDPVDVMFVFYIILFIYAFVALSLRNFGCQLLPVTSSNIFIMSYRSLPLVYVLTTCFNIFYWEILNQSLL